MIRVRKNVRKDALFNIKNYDLYDVLFTAFLRRKSTYF